MSLDFKPILFRALFSQGLWMFSLVILQQEWIIMIMQSDHAKVFP